MITTSQMYWLIMLDSIVKFEALIAAASLFTILAFISSSCDLRDFSKRPRVIAIPLCAVLLVVSVLLFTFTPTTKQMAAIIIVPKIANNEKVQDCGNRLYELAIEWMKELKPNKEGNQ